MQVRFSATNIEQVGVRYRYLQTFFVISFELRPSALFRNFLPFLSCYSECQRGIHSWMLHDVQHDRFELPSLKSHEKIRRAQRVAPPFPCLFIRFLVTVCFLNQLT